VARGVGQSDPGDNPHPLATVRGSNVVSTHHERPAGVAFRFQIFEHPVSSESAEARHVLSEHPTGSHLSHDPEHLAPQPGACGGVVRAEAGSLAGKGYVLAGKSSGHKVNCSDIGPPERAHVGVDRDAGPVVLEHRAAEGLDLAEGHRAEAGLLEAQAHPTDAAEQVEHGHRLGSHEGQPHRADLVSAAAMPRTV
jgi:hypothetical protein